MTGVILSLLAAAFYGSADFCGGLATKRSTMFAVTVLSQAVGLALVLIWLALFPTHATAADYGWGALAGLCGGAGIALLYHALSIGKMGVVSPITAVLAAALPLAVSLARGEHLLPLQIFGVAIALVAIVLISISFEDGGIREISTAGVKEAIASGLVIGGFYLFVSYANRAAGLSSLVAARAVSIALLAAIALAVRSTLKPAPGTKRLIFATGAMDMTANALYVLATFNGLLSVAVVLTSLYPASTVFLARFVLNERLGASQKFGVGLALAGVALIAYRP